MKLTRLEVEALSKFIKSNAWQATAPLIDSDNKREQAEWLEKASLLGINLPQQKQQGDSGQPS